MTACFGSSPRERGHDTVEGEIDAIVDVLGLTDDDYSVQGYRARPVTSDERCPGVEDRWTGSGSATVRHGVVAQDEVVARLSERYLGRGARVRLFRTTTGSGGQVLVAIDSERRVAVKADVSPEGRIGLFLRHSSCSVEGYDVAPEGPYEEVALPG